MLKQITHIAIVPPISTNVSLVAKVAGILKKDPCDTRLLLAGKVPKIISHCDDLQIAESIVQNLRQLGFKAFSIEDAELHQPVEYFPTRTMEIVGSEIIFGDDNFNIVNNILFEKVIIIIFIPLFIKTYFFTS